MQPPAQEIPGPLEVGGNVLYLGEQPVGLDPVPGVDQFAGLQGAGLELAQNGFQVRRVVLPVAAGLVPFLAVVEVCPHAGYEMGGGECGAGLGVGLGVLSEPVVRPEFAGGVALLGVWGGQRHPDVDILAGQPDLLGLQEQGEVAGVAEPAATIFRGAGPVVGDPQQEMTWQVSFRAGPEYPGNKGKRLCGVGIEGVRVEEVTVSVIGVGTRIWLIYHKKAIS